MEALSRLDLRKLDSPLDVGARITAACRTARLVVARTHPAVGRHREFWDEALAEQCERVPVDEDVKTGLATGNLWSDVEFNPEFQQCFRHSSSAQPLHTDGAYLSDPPPIVFLVCHRAAPRGGATLFLDGPQLLSLLSTEQPELLAMVTASRARFRKADVDVESTIIAAHPAGPLLRWNYYAMRNQASPALLAVVEKFHCFLQDTVDRSLPLAVRLNEGDAVFFHDARVLHGRDGFTASITGDRCLWKGALRI
ncbi:MAG: hypothetical protein FD165_1910 [Gammaproteobacteria bacterium]|nr:MAG: hypothetical protein FD165_1910 [Gammaproteobacteria bacterium]TND04482.1 MAG: hypothetical protein FD120_1596 [Gammaproteobacteria bacterium]